jgi:hypothetical protein
MRLRLPGTTKKSKLLALGDPTFGLTPQKRQGVLET